MPSAASRAASSALLTRPGGRKLPVPAMREWRAGMALMRMDGSERRTSAGARIGAGGGRRAAVGVAGIAARVARIRRWTRSSRPLRAAS